MRYLLLLLSFFSYMDAEMSPLVYEKARNSASEYIKIDVLDSKRDRKDDTLYISAKAKVEKVYRTGSNLKKGNIIDIFYTVKMHNESGWVGPTSNIVIKKGKIYDAYLKKIDKNLYTTDAYGKSFDTPAVEMIEFEKEVPLILRQHILR